MPCCKIHWKEQRLINIVDITSLWKGRETAELNVRIRNR